MSFFFACSKSKEDETNGKTWTGSGRRTEETATSRADGGHTDHHERENDGRVQV